MGCPAGTAALLRATATGPPRSRSTGRSTGRSRGTAPRPGGPAPCTSPATSTSCWRRSRRPTTGFPSGRSCCSASSRSPTRRARPTGKHTAWAYTHGPRPASTGGSELDATSSGWRRRSSASRPASATGSSRATCWARPTSSARNRNLVGGDVGGGSYRLRQVVFRPPPWLSPVPDAAARAVPRERRDVSRRRRARRARRRRRARGAPAQLSGRRSTQTNRRTNARAVSATSRQPWSIVSPWPRPGISTISVTPSLRD